MRSATRLRIASAAVRAPATGGALERTPGRRRTAGLEPSLQSPLDDRSTPAGGGAVTGGGTVGVRLAGGDVDVVRVRGGGVCAGGGIDDVVRVRACAGGG